MKIRSYIFTVIASIVVSLLFITDVFSLSVEEVRKSFAMPVTNPSFSQGPYQFRNREFLIITYETDIEALRAIVPEPLKVKDAIVKYEFIKMPDSDGFGSYQESGQVIPVEYKGVMGSYVHSMYLDDVSPIAGGREIWGFPKKYGQPELRVDSINKDCLIGILKYGELEVARATMGYKYRQLDTETVKKALSAPNYLLKVIPDVNGSPKICELVRYNLINITVKEAWTGPGSLQLFEHALAPVAKLPVKRVISAVHFVSDLTIGKGEVVYDYLDGAKKP